MKFKKNNPDHAVQLSFLDDIGCVKFDFGKDAETVSGFSGRFKVAGMLLELSPAPNHPSTALVTVLSVLRETHVARENWNYSKPGHIDPINLDFRDPLFQSCRVTFRSQADDGVIRATYCHGEETFELSIPAPKMWSTVGLGWFAHFKFCCHRGHANPSPWLSKVCSCKVVRFGPGEKTVPAQEE